MIYELVNVIYAALSASFQFADSIFSAVGIALVTAVSMMVLVSTVLRLFTARFVGQQIVQADDRAKERDRKAAESDPENRYAKYKERRIENRNFNRRFRQETKGK